MSSTDSETKSTSPQAKRRKTEAYEPQLDTTDDLLLCVACGAQYDVTKEEGLSECRVCEVSHQGE
jgi:hypothetical protein